MSRGAVLSCQPCPGSLIPRMYSSSHRPHPPRVGPGFDVDDPQLIRFDDDAYQDLLRLQSELRDAKDIERVVYIALELLGLALSYNLTVESRLHLGTKRVFNLWR